ncbi:hypothetical protein M4C72_25205, partial [Klebsiella pneumoniae]|nr:hypothetical protein [Klebsiella pneumoniae]
FFIFLNTDVRFVLGADAQELSFRHFKSEASDSTGPAWPLGERVSSQGIASSVQKSPAHSMSRRSSIKPTGTQT